MLHILLLILKVIGIVLLVLLGVLVTLILLVLFVPLRYHVDIAKKEAQPLQLQMKVYWLLHILSFRFEKGETAQYRLRIFGIPVNIHRHEQEDVSDEADKQKEKTSKMPVQKKIKNKSEDTTEKMGEKKSQEKTEENLTEKNAIEEDMAEEFLEQKVQKDVSEKEADKLVAGTERKGVKERIRQVISFFNSFRKKVLEWIQKMRQFLRKAIRTKEEVTKMLEKIQAFLKNPRNKKGALVLWNATKKMTLHIRPKKWEGQFLVGTDNPADTGKLLGLLSAAGGMVGFMPPITPDFEREIFEGKLWMKGNIRIFTLLRIIFATWRDKNVQYLLHYSKKVFSRG